MTEDDIIDMARKARLAEPYHPFNPWGASQEALERFAKLVAAYERERCCGIVYGMCESDNVAQRTVDAIRARGEK